jgi:hypothetical protein
MIPRPWYGCSRVDGSQVDPAAGGWTGNAPRQGSRLRATAPRLAALTRPRSPVPYCSHSVGTMRRRSAKQRGSPSDGCLTIRTPYKPAPAKARVKLGPISKRGNGYLRRLLVNGAMSVLCSKRARTTPGWSNYSPASSAKSPPARWPEVDPF